MTNELALLITARDQAQDTLKGLNKQITLMGQGAGTTTGAFSAMDSGVVSHIGHMTHGFERFTTSIGSGSVTGIIRGFFTMITTGMKAVEAEEAIMTLGITALIAALVFAVDKIKGMWADAKASAKLYADFIKDMGKDEADLAKSQIELAKTTAEKRKAMQLSGELEIHNKITAMREEAYKKYEKNEELKLKRLEEIDKIELNDKKLLAAALKKYDEDVQVAANNNFKALKASKKKENAAELKEQDHIYKLKIAGEEKEAAQRLKNKEWVAAQLLKISEKNAEDEERTYEKEYNKIADLSQGLGAAIAAGVGKGSAGLKESLKAILNTVLSFVEKQMLLAIPIAGFKAFLGDPTAWFKMGTIVAGFEAAKAGVNSFQTPYGGQRQVPGPYGMPQAAVVHGGEIIGRPERWSGGGIHYHVYGHVFGLQESMERIRTGLWQHSKRTGLPVSAVA